VKEGPLRLTLIALAPGGEMPEHQADGPISVHVVDGQFQFTAAGREYPLREGDVLMVAAGVRHSARSETGGTILLTVVHLPSAGTPLPDRS
jgi:quercetin dioxygenase-like cupin family protein